MTTKSPNSVRIKTRRIIGMLAIILVIGLLSLAVGFWGEITDYKQARRVEAQFEADRKMPPLSKENPPSPETFTPIRVLPKFPAITNFAVVDNTEASEIITDDELVLGIEINGQSRVYPLNMLNGPTREILNDELGGTAIAATW